MRPLVWVRGGRYEIGSDKHYPEERPRHVVAVDGFWIDPFPVTNDDFMQFVAATGYRTVAERPFDLSIYPGAIPELAVPGALVFRMTHGPVNIRDMRNWWHYLPGACWHAPEGPGSSVAGRGDHPVVHVAYEDAEAYVDWAGKALPTEAEWEVAARGGLAGAEYCWGELFAPDGQQMANTWQGPFPWCNLMTDGYVGTSPVGSFAPNGFGLFDMAGNVWEWTSDLYRPSHGEKAATSCCVQHVSRVVRSKTGDEEGNGPATISRRVVKGGSFLCSPDYCMRYRPAARQPQMVDSAMSHLGFRCVVRP